MKTRSKLKAPFPYFGGKSTIAAVVWERLGDVPNYVEHFFGSGAMLLARPHEPGVETVNDLDGFICNFWRAVQANPTELAALMDWPVNEIDLHARHRWLCRQPDKSEFVERMRHDPDHYDVKRAAWWCWGLCAWIGRGWCEGEYSGQGSPENFGAGVCEGTAKRPDLAAGRGVHRTPPEVLAERAISAQRPHLGDAGQGMHRPPPEVLAERAIWAQLPHLGNAGKGVHAQRPHLGNPGVGVHAQLPHLGDAGRGVLRGAITSREALVAWMLALQSRLRRVRVCCGDWSRVCGTTPTIKYGLTGVFLDPPYCSQERDPAIYREESLTVAREVAAWCREWGNHEDMRIALCGYDGDYDLPGWEVVSWKEPGGYSNIQPKQSRRDNRRRERIWFSPHCLKPELNLL